MGRGCPKSQQARKSAETNNKNKRPTRDDSNNSKPSAQATLKVKSDGKTRVVTTTKPSSISEEDLRIKINAKRVAKATPKDQVETPVHISLPPQKEIVAGEPQSEQIEGGSNDVEPNAEATSSLSSVDLIEIELLNLQIDGPRMPNTNATLGGMGVRQSYCHRL